MPYLRIAVPMILLFALVCDQVYQRQVLEIDDQILQLWIPLILPWIPVLIWLRPRFKLLKMKRSGRADPDTALSMLAAFSIFIPMMLIAMYMEEATGKLQQLNWMTDIVKAPPTRYYEFNHLFADKKSRGLYYSSYTSGKYNSTLNFEIHIVTPLYNDEPSEYPDDIGIIAPPSSNTAGEKVVAGMKLTPPKAAAKDSIVAGYGTVTEKDGEHAGREPAAPVAWLGIKYQTSIGNRVETARKKEKEHAFYYECVQRFNDSDLSHFNYYTRVAHNPDRRLYRKAALRTPNSGNINTTPLLTGTIGDFDKRTGNRALWIFLIFLIGSSLLATILYFVKLDDVKLAAMVDAEGGF